MKQQVRSVINFEPSNFVTERKGERLAWCSTLADLLTSAATELEGDVVLTELAEALQLPSDLLAL